MEIHSSAGASVYGTSIVGVESAWSDLRALVGAENMRAATEADRVDGGLPRMVIEPGNADEVAAALKIATGAGLKVIPRGGGSKMGWGNLLRNGESRNSEIRSSEWGSGELILSTRRLSRVLEHAWGDMTATVEAGCTFQQFQQTLAEHGQRLALDPLWPGQSTIGGILATNDSGALRVRFGSLRDLIIGITLALPDGTLAKSGGKVVKNVAGYDLPKLATGALGTLGIITRATFRLHPLPQEACTLSCLARDAREAQRPVLAVQNSKLAHSALQIRFVESMQPQIDVLFEATQAGLTAQVEQLKLILAPSAVIDPGPAVWNARQELYSAAKDNESGSALAKISVLPSQIAEAFEILSVLAANRARCNAVMQATGIGSVHLEAMPAVLAGVLKTLRTKLEAIGGSAMIVHAP